MTKQKTTTPAEAGKMRQNPEELERTTTENVAWIGGHRYMIVDDGAAYRVDLAENTCGCEKAKGECAHVAQAVEAAPVQVTQTHIDRAAFDILGEAVRMTREATEIVNDATLTGVSGASSGSEGGSEDEAPEDVEIVRSPPSEHDYDAEELVESVDQWLTNYATVEPGLIEDAWELSFKEIYDPRSETAELGVLIESDPWHGPFWDNSERSWATEDGERPDEWAEHSDALRGILTRDGSVAEGVPEDDDDSGYTTWHNYVPAQKADEDLGGN